MAITITSVSYKVNDLYLPSLSQAFFWGNVGDEVEVEILFSTPTTIDGVEYFFGLNDNNIDPYAGNSSGDYSTSDTLYQSVTTGAVQKFTGPLGGFPTPSNPKSWQDGLLEFTGSAPNYTLKHTFTIDPLILPIQLNPDGTISPDYPSLLAGAKSLKYLFRINVRNSLNPTALESTDDIDMSAYHGKGNVGFIGEFLNQGADNYTLDSFAFANAADEIDGNVSSTGFGQIKNNVGSFDAADRMFLFAAEVPNTFVEGDRLQENYGWEKLVKLADGLVINGTKIINFESGVNVSDNTLIDFGFEVLPNFFTENYIFFIGLSTDNANANHQNIFIRSGVAFAEIPVTDSIELLKNTGSTYAEDDFHFLPWWEVDKNSGYNHVHAFRADDILALWRVRNNMPSDTTIEKFIIEFVRQDSGAVIAGETYTLNLTTTSFPYELERNEVRNDSNDKKYLRVTENIFNTDYDFEVGFQVWKQWIFEDTILQFTVTGTQFGEPFARTFQSPRFVLGQYNTTQNTALEPQGLPRTPIAIEYTALDPSTGSVIATGLDSIVAGADTLVKAYWEDNNLNDLQVTVGDLVAYLGINIAGDAQSSARWFYSVYDAEASTPWKEVSGHTAGRVKVELPAIDTATAEAVIVWADLVNIFGASTLANSKLCVISRMDKIQVNIANFYEVSFHFRGSANDLTRLLWTLTEAMTGGVLTLDPNALEPSLTYYLNGGVQSPQSTWLAAIASGIPSDTTEIETAQLSSTEGGDLCLVLRWGTSNPINPSTYNTDMSSKDSNDTVWFFNERVEFGASAGGGTTLAAVRGFSLGEDWTSFPFSLGSPAALNATIAALPVGTRYAVHVWQDSAGADATGSLTYLDNPSLESRGYLSDNTDSSYRDALHSKNAMSFDGINDSLHLPSAALNNEFSVFNPITVLIASNDAGGVTNAFSTFLSNVVLSAGGGGDVGGGLSFGTFNGFPRITFFDNGPAMVKNLTHGRIMRTKRNIIIYQVDPVDTGGGIYDITLRIWHNGYKQETVIVGINSATYSTVNGANTIGVCEYDSATTSKTLRKSIVAKIEMIKSIATDQECRMATNSGTFKSAGTFSYALDIDFSVGTPIDTGIHAVVPTVFGAPFNTPY